MHHPTPAPRRCQVLIVEDTATVAALIQVYLMGWPLEFRVAKNGKEAFDLAMLKRPDLVLSDVQMPILDGFGLCAVMRSTPELAQVPIVLLTSLTDAASRHRGMLVGATAFLTKPVTPDALRTQVAHALNLPAPAAGGGA